MAGGGGGAAMGGGNMAGGGGAGKNADTAVNLVRVEIVLLSVVKAVALLLRDEARSPLLSSLSK